MFSSSLEGTPLLTLARVRVSAAPPLISGRYEDIPLTWTPLETATAQSRATWTSELFALSGCLTVSAPAVWGP